jgi:membrane protein
VYVLVERDGDVGGGIMSGALAYRIFIWLLPFGLVVVGGIGLVASVAEESAEDAARSVGISGIVAHSVAEASRGSSRWYALAIGIPVLLWATRSLLRALLVVHRLVWGDLRQVVPKPKAGATLRLLGLLIAYFAVRELARWIGSSTGSVVLSVLVGFAGVFAWWLVLSWRLPHRDAPWPALVPGAVVMAVGLELLSVVSVFLIAPRVESSQSAYGALGVAATLLFGLYIVSRLVVASAVLNATAWDRRRAARPANGLGSPDSGSPVE